MKNLQRFKKLHIFFPPCMNKNSLRGKDAEFDLLLYKSHTYENYYDNDHELFSSLIDTISRGLSSNRQSNQFNLLKL